MTLSGFVIDGLPPVARERPGDGEASGESARFMGGLMGIAAGFGEEFVFPLHLLIADLMRRGQGPDVRAKAERARVP